MAGTASSWSEPPEGRERGLHGGEVTSRHQAAGERQACGITEQVGLEVRGGAVLERPKRSCHGHGAEPDLLLLGEVAEVQHHPFRNPEPARAPGEGKREVQLRGQHIGEVVQGERRLVREDARLFRPEPDGGEVFVIARGEVDDAIDATPNTEHATSAEVMGNELRRVASLRRLLRGEEAVLGGRRLEELVPIGRGVWGVDAFNTLLYSRVYTAGSAHKQERPR